MLSTRCAGPASRAAIRLTSTAFRAPTHARTQWSRCTAPSLNLLRHFSTRDTKILEKEREAGSEGKLDIDAKAEQVAEEIAEEDVTVVKAVDAEQMEVGEDEYVEYDEDEDLDEDDGFDITVDEILDKDPDADKIDKYDFVSQRFSKEMLPLPTADELNKLAEKYSYLDWSRFAEYMHTSDVRFFDNEVPFLDQRFDITPDFAEMARTDYISAITESQQREEDKLFRLLNKVRFIDSGRTVRVAPEGKIESFWSLYIAGDGNGTATYGIGKASDTMQADARAKLDLRRNLHWIPLHESRTIPEARVGHFGVCSVTMKPMNRGHGMIAGLIPRLIFECFGIEDITAKVIGRMLPRHQVLAVFNGLRNFKTVREQAMAAGVNPYKVFGRRDEGLRHPSAHEMNIRSMEVSKRIHELNSNRSLKLDKSRFDPSNPRCDEEHPFEVMNPRPTFFIPNPVNSSPRTASTRRRGL